ncbi:Asparagine-linked glycosylation 6 (alpha-1 3 -glucosyltransferase) [Trichostrongylus colubriformis]|uniref:Alpha-1,3-glucosyltransferase n=1 Tax=Trichostrongylus colubriformis TaxID=6319 RepID=A0AAN8G7U8_TRICO
METWTLQLNPKYTNVGKDDAQKFHPYSASDVVRENRKVFAGSGKPPMYGDFEAQRHWMEITFHLLPSQWYVNGSDNDLLYWGLDYPPLTAYHSYFMGILANSLNPAWVALNTSKGIQNEAHKMFMRVTAILPFHLIYAPSLIYFVYFEVKTKDISKNLLLALTLLYPGLLTIDNAHFQYNNVSLGLFLFSFLFFINGKFLFGSVSFVLALNYKQMELYHALPIFTFILSRCLKRPILTNCIGSARSLLKVAATVMLTFAIMWLPFLYNGPQSVLAALGRIFPFYRGLYEDKVASVWCAFSFILRMNTYFSVDMQVKISAVSVLLVVTPSLFLLFLRPTTKNFTLSLLITSLGFFLFSFQVHEKSILLAAIPALLLLPDYQVVVVWFLHITNTSLFSLCLKDDTGLIFALFIGYYVVCSSTVKFPRKPLLAVYHLSCLGALAICVAEWTLTPPRRYPHIFPLLNAIYSCSHFLLFMAYFYVEMIRNEYEVLIRKSL